MERHNRDRDRHSRNDRHSQERYSLQELKRKARHERGDHRPRYDSRDSRAKRRSRSRSPNRSNIAEQKSSYSRSSDRDHHFPPPSDHHYKPRQQGRQHFDRDDHRRSQQNTDFNRSGMNVPPTENDSKPEEEKEEEIKLKPNFELTGSLSKDTNMFNGVLVKYNEPPEAKKPRKQWRFYPFKGDTPLDFIPLNRQSAYLFGRDRRVADVPVDHPSCSKQHAVLQFRSIEVEREDGTKARATRPYIIDLESGNGTFVNNKQIEARRYVELMEKDVIKFGFSTREYVLLHDQSQGDIQEESPE